MDEREIEEKQNDKEGEGVYLSAVLFDTSSETKSVTLYSKFQMKINHIFGRICYYGKKYKIN
jgi:hypothetical protein